MPFSAANSVVAVYTDCSSECYFLLEVQIICLHKMYANKTEVPANVPGYQPLQEILPGGELFNPVWSCLARCTWKTGVQCLFVMNAAKEEEDSSQKKRSTQGQGGAVDPQIAMTSELGSSCTVPHHVSELSPSGAPSTVTPHVTPPGHEPYIH